VDKLLENESTAALIQQLNPSFARPARPFKRIAYVDAIAWLNEHGIEHEAEDAQGNVIKDADGNPRMVPHAVGDDIAEAAERRMTDVLGVPVFLHSFPASLKSFYMKRKKEETAPAPAGSGSDQPGGVLLTESCDLLMPGVGEIVGGSMRITDIEELFAAYKREGIDPAPYYWFTDQRKYGTCEHGGYGLGVEVCNSFFFPSLYPALPR
jgi:asparaginyl-tRNA synthetase